MRCCVLLLNLLFDLCDCLLKSIIIAVLTSWYGNNKRSSTPFVILLPLLQRLETWTGKLSAPRPGTPKQVRAAPRVGKGRLPQPQCQDVKPQSLNVKVGFAASQPWVPDVKSSHHSTVAARKVCARLMCCAVVGFSAARFRAFKRDMHS